MLTLISGGTVISSTGATATNVLVDGETVAALIEPGSTAFGSDLMNANPFIGPQESLPLFVYRNIRKPDATAIARGFAGALVLMLVVLALFGFARFIGRDRSKSGRRRSAREEMNEEINWDAAVAPIGEPPGVTSSHLRSCRRPTARRGRLLAWSWSAALRRVRRCSRRATHALGSAITWSWKASTW